MLVSLTVGKVDAGVAVLLTEDKRLIEFPSILLPPSISSGSVVDITVSRNHNSEAQAQKSFHALQSSIFSTYGQHSPSQPQLRCRNATQTSVVLEWDPIQLATAELRSLSLYRNGSKAGIIPRPLEITSTKISGLAIDTAYTFHLVLRTSAGQYSSEKLTVRTHKMTDLSGITVSPGVLPAPLRESLSGAVERIGAKLVENVRIDTTHFVCTEGRGREWEKAVEMNIPVVRPEWVEGCEREGRIVGVRGYYLGANPKDRQVGQGVGFQQQQQQQQQRARTESQMSQQRTAPATLVQREQRRPETPAQPPREVSTTSAPTNGASVEDERPTPPAKDEPEPEPEPVEESSDDDDPEHGSEEPSPERESQQFPSRELVPSPPSSGKKSVGDLRPRVTVEDDGKKELRSPVDGGDFSEVQL